MKNTLKTEYTTRRLKSSASGNQRYELRTPEGSLIGSTRPDSSLAYGEVPNNEGEGLCIITVHETPSGRRYVEDVKALV